MSNHNTVSEQSQKSFYKPRKLPHLFSEHHPVFITYRLKFSLPRPLIKELNTRKAQWQRELQNMKQEERELAQIGENALLFEWYDELLARSEDLPKTLHRADITEIIASAFMYFDNVQCQMLAYCIMPNHVHVLFAPMKQESGEIFAPSRIVYSWKRWTANQINKVLGRKGGFWQQESYDRMVRDEEELLRTINYIVQNPVKAGLVDKWRQWKGSWIREDYAQRFVD